MKLKFVMGEDYSRADIYYLLFPLFHLPPLLQSMIDPPGKLIRRWNEHTGSSLSLFLSHSLCHTNTLTSPPPHPPPTIPPSLPPPPTSQSRFRSGLFRMMFTWLLYVATQDELNPKRSKKWEFSNWSMTTVRHSVNLVSIGLSPASHTQHISRQ